MRALTSIREVFMVPNALALLTINPPYGKWENITVGLSGPWHQLVQPASGVFALFFVQLTP